MLCCYCCRQGDLVAGRFGPVGFEWFRFTSTDLVEVPEVPPLWHHIGSISTAACLSCRRSAWLASRFWMGLSPLCQLDWLDGDTDGCLKSVSNNFHDLALYSLLTNIVCWASSKTRLSVKSSSDSHSARLAAAVWDTSALLSIMLFLKWFPRSSFWETFLLLLFVWLIEISNLRLFQDDVHAATWRNFY